MFIKRIPPVTFGLISLLFMGWASVQSDIVAVAIDEHGNPVKKNPDVIISATLRSDMSSEYFGYFDVTPENTPLPLVTPTPVTTAPLPLATTDDLDPLLAPWRPQGPRLSSTPEEAARNIGYMMNYLSGRREPIRYGEQRNPMVRCGVWGWVQLTSMAKIRSDHYEMLHQAISSIACTTWRL